MRPSPNTGKPFCTAKFMFTYSGPVKPLRPESPVQAVPGNGCKKFRRKLDDLIGFWQTALCEASCSPELEIAPLGLSLTCTGPVTLTRWVTSPAIGPAKMVKGCPEEAVKTPLSCQ